MKTFFLATTLAALSFSFTSYASGTKEKSVATYRSIQSLGAEFGDVENLHWSSASNNLIRADFMVDDQQTTAFFDESGEFVASTRAVDMRELPKPLKTEISKKLAGSTISNILYMSSKDENAYFIETLDNGVKKVWKGLETGYLKHYKVQ